MNMGRFGRAPVNRSVAQRSLHACSGMSVFHSNRNITVTSRVSVWCTDPTRSITFICPCIASISLKYNQQDATFSRPIYFYKLLYTFQAIPPPITGTTKLYIQRQVLSKQYCCLLLWWMIHDNSRRQYWFHNTWRCMYNFVLLMMGGGTTRNMQSNL
jgi:hypothetical protein